MPRPGGELVRTVDQLAAAQDRLAGWISDLTTVHDLTERLARTTSLESALDEVLRAGASLVGARRGLVALEPADGLGPERTVGLGLGRADLGQIETIPRGSGFYGRLLDGLPESGPRDAVSQPDILGEDDLDPRHREVAARLGYAASYAVPLTTGTEPDPGAAHPHGTGDTETHPRGTHPTGTHPRTDVPAPEGTAARPEGTGSTRPPSADPAVPESSADPAAGTRGTDPSGAAHRMGAAVWLYDEPAEPTERQRHLLGLYLAVATEHIARQLTLTRARAAVTAVREELMPSRLPRVPGVQFAVRHRTGPRGGGDWYDVLPLPEGALGLSVGGVTGSGPTAVAASGRLRASLRAYAVMEGEDPVAVLSDLELLMRLTEPARTATALFGFAEPALRKIVVAGAGHCPPLIVGPRRCEFAETTLSAPLGMLTCWEAPSVDLYLEPGETLLLYSDGLVQRTGEPLDQAFIRLQAAAKSAAPSVRDDPEALVEHVLRTVLPDGLADADSEEDVVLLAARF
ncbi:SpoIIE family protein phosphatase [Streptomyces sp. 549]|uniref:PP2C family protein-serine/threonine phosphatase n=1 Tax=Streptomyces sp. 549 TaxID=3049076 RepID=UPI0024C27CD1|nr:PP2C family protein-serine/threonine phosphatase [Streptomyces sp. 549]MDK1474971.1 SpoIIE family protein phosphatase [Streptomyces sp. 549]